MAKETKTRTDALVELYNTLSNDDLEWLITFAFERMFIWNPNDKKTYELDPDCPACPNGPQIQINLKEE